MPSLLLENTIKSDLNVVLYDLIVKHGVTPSVSANIKL